MVFLYANSLNLPPQVKGMICDCGFTSPKQEISHCVKHYFKISAFPLVNILNLYCKIFAKFGLSDVSCKEFLTIKCNVHAVSYLENTALYQEKIDNFLKNINF